MSTPFVFDWGHALLILLFCPSLITLPAVYVLRRVIGRTSMSRRARLGVLLHLGAILAVTIWFIVAMMATLRDVTAGGGYVFLGFIVLMPLNGILTVVGAVLMLLEDRTKASTEPPPLP